MNVYKSQKYMQNCIYTEGVACEDRVHCPICGWNPKVADERHAMLLERLRGDGKEAAAESGKTI